MNRILFPHIKPSLKNLTKPLPRRALHSQASTSIRTYITNNSGPSLQTLQRSSSHPSPGFFSTIALHQTQQVKPKSPPHKQVETIEAAPFSELGATKTVKVIVIIALSIIGTIETYTYGLWIWNKWFRKQEVVKEE